jgi:hypothetical protein
MHRARAEARVSLFVRELPRDAEAARRAIYEGTVFHLAPTEASRAFVELARAELVRVLGFDDVRAAHARLSPGEFFDRMGRVRRRLYLEPDAHEHVRAVIASLGFDPARVAFDPARLRVVAHRGHENPAAAPVYYAHRDTWYAHPQALVTWWIPLDDLAEEETFVFHPESFARPVPNDSEIFDYDAWVRDGWSLKIGWQDKASSSRARYPGVVGTPDPGPAVGFSCRRAEVLLFSGAHFHGTRPHATGRTRYSLDFRVVDLEDARDGRGAPNVDGRSRGSALPDYVAG